MSTLTKMALGKMGRLRPKPALGESAPAIALPAPECKGGMPLMEALPLLSALLWAGCGVNRPDGGTSPRRVSCVRGRR